MVLICQAVWISSLRLIWMQLLHQWETRLLLKILQNSKKKQWQTLLKIFQAESINLVLHLLWFVSRVMTAFILKFQVPHRQMLSILWLWVKVFWISVLLMIVQLLLLKVIIHSIRQQLSMLLVNWWILLLYQKIVKFLAFIQKMNMVLMNALTGLL